MAPSLLTVLLLSVCLAACGPVASSDPDLSFQLADSVRLLDGVGGLSVGTPEALSESGGVGRAFGAEAIRFSPSHGQFEIRVSASANP